LTEVALGNVEGVSIIRALGERETMAVTASGEDIWRGNELTSPVPASHTTIPTPPSIGEQMSLKSSSANDTAAGSGARTIEIHYLDASGAEQEEVVNLNGTTAVDTVATDIRFVQHIHAIDHGTGLVTAGNVTIFSKSTTDLIYSMISTGGNFSLVPHRMVPAGKTLILRGWHGEEAQDKRVNLRIRSTDHEGVVAEGVFLFKDTVYLRKNTSGYLPIFEPIPAFSIVKISGWGDQSGAEVACSWTATVHDNV
ncbi:MAG: hypothetical protein GY821_02410, partial [Gammaproteobacteria bacterium]|nr:hypothetical protein [Gammaproteobacteria bacterium]